MEALFSVGQKVVCVDSKDYHPEIKADHPPLIEGKPYINNENYICSCGLVKIDVGIKIPSGIALMWCKCGRNKLTRQWFVDQTRFVPLDDNDAIEDEIRESLNLHLKV